MGSPYFEGWKKEIVWLAALYELVEKGTKIPTLTHGTNFSFADGELLRMAGLNLIEMVPDRHETFWKATPKGREVIGKLVAAFDNALKFEIFGAVDITPEVPDDFFDEEGNIHAHIHDPRFPVDENYRIDDTGETTYDLRLLMINFVGQALLNDGKVDALPPLHRIVSIQKLADGEWAQRDFWFNLAMGTFFNEVEEIVDTAYSEDDLNVEDPDELFQIVAEIYTAGMLEQQRRDGSMCSSCEIPLGVFVQWAHADGEELNECPNPDCGSSFETPKALATHTCPSCDSDIFRGDTTCRGCGASINYALPSGTNVHDTEEIVEYVDVVVGYDVSIDYVPTYEYDPWDHGYDYYDYRPYGYYNAYDPFVDAVAFGCLCAILW